MNEDLLTAVTGLLRRANSAGRFGELADAAAMNQLVRDCAEQIPGWYVELLVRYPIGLLEIGWRANAPEEGYDGIAWMELADPKGIRSESLECYPGLAILEKGWINIASDSMGSGDPYFIPTYEGNNPPVFQVYHDVSDKGEVILAEGCRLVAPSLSELFNHATIAPA